MLRLTEIAEGVLAFLPSSAKGITKADAVLVKMKHTDNTQTQTRTCCRHANVMMVCSVESLGWTSSQVLVVWSLALKKKSSLCH